MLYPSTDLVSDTQDADANWYPPFKSADSTIVKRLADELEVLEDSEGEGTALVHFFHQAHLELFSAPCALVGALTKALCCMETTNLCL